MTVTLHFQSTGTVPGNGKPFTMVGHSISIGRSDQNDLVLPDPEKIVSGRHCSIEDHNGNVVVVDLSTNGTFLNYGKLALGNTPTPLNDGDILSMGTYELMVDIKTAASANPQDLLADPLEAGPVSHGDASAALDASSLLDDPSDGVDFLDELLGGPDLKGPSAVQREELGDDGLMPPLGADDSDLMAPLEDPNANLGGSYSSHSSALEDHFVPPSTATNAIPDDWDLDLETGTSTPEPTPAAPPVNVGAPAFIPDDLDDLGIASQEDDFDPFAQEPEPPQPIPAQTLTPPTPAPSPVTASAGPSDAAARAFLAAAGVDADSIADEDLLETMQRMGASMRIMVEGLREILMTRTSIKSEFRINQTVISSGGNNPLKFSVSAQQAVEALVKRPLAGFLDATTATAEAMDDIKAHEVAVMSGMEAAIKGVIARLSPEELEKIIRQDNSFRSVLTNKKARYWDVFEKRYQKIADQAENDFHVVFSKEFARAYQEQLEKLKK